MWCTLVWEAGEVFVSVRCVCGGGCAWRGSAGCGCVRVSGVWGVDVCAGVAGVTAVRAGCVCVCVWCACERAWGVSEWTRCVCEV